MIGRVSLKDLVREATDVIERLCIEAALEMTGDNRASAAEMLGLSRQSLYVKLRRYGLGDLAAERRELAAVDDAPPGAPPRRVLELLKPITWFAPMWAFGCGVVSAGAPLGQRWPLVVAGVAAGRAAGLRHEPGGQRLVRPPRRRHQRAGSADPVRAASRAAGVSCIALGWTALSLAVAAALGTWGVRRGGGRAGAGLGLQRAAAAAEAQRLVGQCRLAACYEGLPWITGAAVMAGARAERRVLALAGLYSAGAHGIMTLNDFKSVEGDRRPGIGSLPVCSASIARRGSPASRWRCRRCVVVVLLRLGRPAGAARSWRAARWRSWC